MTRRMLPPSEYSKLADTGMLLPPLKDASVGGHVVVVEDEAAIVGTLMLAHCFHAEGAWIAPRHRHKGAVGRHLYRALVEQGTAAGVSRAIVSVMDTTVGAMFAALQAEAWPGQHFTVRW